MVNLTCWHDGCTQRKTKWGMCQNHYLQWVDDVNPLKTRFVNMSTSERFWKYVDRKKVSECWNWRGALDSNGYAVFNLGRAEGGGQTKGHRFAYKELRGEIPARSGGLRVKVEYLCRIRPCCNPWHIKVVLYEENGDGVEQKGADKTHCPEGHPLAGDNLIVSTSGYSSCRACTYDRNNAARATPEARARRRETRPAKTQATGRGSYQLERTHCPKGHPYAGENLIVEKRRAAGGGIRDVRRCRTCVNATARDVHGRHSKS